MRTNLNYPYHGPPGGNPGLILEFPSDSPRMHADDGKRPSLACATSARKVIVHCPHTQRGHVPGAGSAPPGASSGASESVGAGGDPAENPAGDQDVEREFGGDTRFLNINREVHTIPEHEHRAREKLQGLFMHQLPGG